MGNSTITLQDVVDDAQSTAELEPTLNAGGFSMKPALNLANRTIQYMLGESFPFKFNQFSIPAFYANSYQQDYAVPGVTNIAWLQEGSVLCLSNTAVPKPRYPVEVGKWVPQLSNSFVAQQLLSNPKFFVCWLPNDQLYYGTWGGNAAGQGNDPVANSLYTNPIGQPSQPSNPITQIRDANGNLLVLTTYGREGSAAPLAALNAVPGVTASGTGATTVWTVVDPKGQGFRIAPVPSLTGSVWRFDLYGQMRPPLFTSLGQTIDPIPDDYSQIFMQGFRAYCYQKSTEAKVRAKFKVEFDLWEAELKKGRMKSDRERDEAGFIVDTPLVRPVNTGYAGPAWPYSYPIN